MIYFNIYNIIHILQKKKKYFRRGVHLNAKSIFNSFGTYIYKYMVLIHVTY